MTTKAPAIRWGLTYSGDTMQKAGRNGSASKSILVSEDALQVGN